MRKDATLFEYCVGDEVVFLPHAEVSRKVRRLFGVVSGYEFYGGKDYVTVDVRMDGRLFSQLLEIGEIAPSKRERSRNGTYR